MQWTTLLSLPVLSFALIMAGCIPAPNRAKNDYLDSGNYPQVVGLGDIDDLSVGDAVIYPGPNPPMRVDVPVRIEAKEARAVQYRFIFLDAMGGTTQNDFPWQYKTIQPRVAEFFRGKAMSPSATDWRLEIKPASEGVEYR